MSLQFGGNFDPVMRACEYDWTECPFALANYIWFEAVTDVADCLANETILWRILAVLLVCTTIVQLIYWKVRWMKEIKLNKESLKKVGFKVQDLELKVNILTYKAQYGTWPLPHFAKKNTKNNLRNIQLAVSKLRDDNSWIRQLLASAHRKQLSKDGVFRNVQSQTSINDSNVLDMEIKYISSNFGDVPQQKTHFIDYKLSQTNIEKEKSTDIINDNFAELQLEKHDSVRNGPMKISTINLPEESIIDSNLKTLRSFSENSLSHHSNSIILGTKQNVKSNIDTKMMKSAEQKRKLFPLSANIALHSNKYLSKFKEQTLSSSTSDTEIKRDSQETLYQVQEKLENLHSTLRNYNLEDSQKDGQNVYQNSSKINNNLKEDNLRQDKENNSSVKYNCLENLYNQCNNEKSIDLQNSINIFDTSKIITTYSIYNTMIMNRQVPAECLKQTTNEEYSTSDELLETSQDEEMENKIKVEKPNVFILPKEQSIFRVRNNKNISDNNTTAATGTYWTEIDDYSKDIKSISQNIVLSENDTTVTCLKSSLVETAKKSDSDDKSKNTLLQDTLQFKKEVVPELELKTNESENNEQKLENEDEPCTYLGWENIETNFQPKILDMITEESSGSSSTDKRSTRILETTEKYEILEENIYHITESDQHSGLDNPLVNDPSVEAKVSENKILIEEKDSNFPNDENNQIIKIYETENNNETIQFNENVNLILDIESTDNSTKNVADDFTKSIPENLSGSEIEASDKVNEVNIQKKVDSLDIKDDLNIKDDLKIKDDLNIKNDFNIKDDLNIKDGLNINDDLNLNLLSDSSSDTSVNRLIDRLIESERKSAKFLSDTISKKVLAVDSLNNFLESTQFENEECDNFSVEFNTEKCNRFEGEKIIEDFELVKEDNVQSKFSEIKEIEIDSPKSIHTVINSSNNNFEQSEAEKEEVTYNENILDNKNLNLQDNLLKNSASILDASVQIFKTEDEKHYLDNSAEPDHKNSNESQFECDTNKVLNQNLNMPKQHDAKNENLNKDMFNAHHDDSKNENLDKDIFDAHHDDAKNENLDKDISTAKNDVNFISNNTFIRNEDSVDKLINTISENEIVKINNKKDAGDCYNNNKSFMQEFQSEEDNRNSKSCETVKNAEKNTLPAGDTNSPALESTFSISPRKSKPNLYHANCKASSIIQFSSGLRNLDNVHNVPKIHKITSSNSIRRQSVKSSFDLGNNRQLKAKSNLNLTTVEKTSPIFTHRRSKSYVTPLDISLSIKNQKVERKKSVESLPLSVTPPLKLHTPRGTQSDDPAKNFEATKENSFESFETSSKIPISSKVTLTDEQDVKFEMKGNNSYRSLTLSSRSSSKSHIPISPRIALMDDQSNKSDIRKKISTESLPSKSLLKSSCIPILKNRLEAVRKTGYDSCPQTPVRELRTAVKDNCSPDERIEHKNEDWGENFHQLMVKKDITLTQQSELQPPNISKQRAVFYVNIMNENGQIITKMLNPKQFLEYLKEKDTAAADNNQLLISSDAQTNSSATDHNLTEASSTDSSVLLGVQNVPSKFWSLKADSKETEVLVKPSTVDTSTSISDLSVDAVKSKTNLFKIFEVPEELTKEEYILLLQMINEDPELQQLPSMDTLCNKLSQDVQK